MTVKAPCLAVLGTGSDVGKSIITTALCRIFADRGMRVAPFKAQNMSNNSGVTPEGLEMGRAQIVQAEAARIAPHVDMNPVLLKPTSDVGSQVVLNGKAWIDAAAKTYYQKKEILFNKTCAALLRLRNAYDLVVIEGAGSCAEVNLLDNDIVNLRTAVHADAPVILVADIHRGGVFAQIVGTLACLDEIQQAQIKGFIINRFRGDIDVFKNGVKWIEARTGKPVFGVLPWFSDFAIEAEDAVAIEQPERFSRRNTALPFIAIIRLPHISNFTDFEPLNRIDGIELTYVEKPCHLDQCKAVILPGSKSTRSDLQWLKQTGWQASLYAYAENGGHLLGICGGYQILGREISDPDGVEGSSGVTPGLGLLPVTTELKAPKTTTLTDFTWCGTPGVGYEIHMGQTRQFGGEVLFTVHARNQISCKDYDGCISSNGHVIGTYLHGLFDTPEITRQWLKQIGLTAVSVNQLHGPQARDHAYDQLAQHFKKHIDIPSIDRLLL